LAGKLIVVSAYKGGVGKTLLSYELAYLMGAVLLDLDWDKGNASRAWGYREEDRVNSPLLDALDRGRVPRPLAGGPWRPDLVPCSADFGANQPETEKLTDALSDWAVQWGREFQCPVVIDTHPGAGSATFAAVAAAHGVVVPTVLGEREMEATEGMVVELKSYRILLVPNKVGVSPPDRYIKWLGRIAAGAFVPVGPAISNYPWLTTRQRRMAICATDPPPARARPLVNELHRVAERVIQHVAA
jgi:chromosome partitioning protein